MLLQMEWLCPLVLLCAATCAMSSRGMMPHSYGHRRALADGRSPPSITLIVPPSGINSSSVLTPAPPAPGLFSLLPELMRLTKSMKVSGYSGGGLNLSFTDPVPIAGKGTPANISGDLVQSDMHSSPNSISIDVNVDPTISVGGNVNFITPDMPSFPGLTGTPPPIASAPGPSTVQAKALGMSKAAVFPGTPSAAAIPPVLRPADSLYFDRGSQLSAVAAGISNASRNSTILDNLAVDAAIPVSAAPTDSSSPGLQQRQYQSPVLAESGLLSLSRLLNLSQLPTSQPDLALALQPGGPAIAPSVNASPADVAEDVLAGLRSAVETVAGAEALAPDQALAPQGTAATAQPASRTATERQGSTADGRDPCYGYTWAVILAAVSSTVSCALLLAALLALGLGRRWGGARRQAVSGAARAGAAHAEKPPGCGGGGPPGVPVMCNPSRGSCPDGANQRRQPGWMDKPHHEYGFALPHLSHVAPESPRLAGNHPVISADEAGMPMAASLPASIEEVSTPSSAMPLMSSNTGKEGSWSSPESRPPTKSAAGTPIPWWAGSNSAPVPLKSPFANAAGSAPNDGRTKADQELAMEHSGALPPTLASPFAKTDLPPFSMAIRRLLLQA